MGEPEAPSGHDPGRETGERGRGARTACCETGGPDPAVPSSDAPAKGQNGADRCRSRMGRPCEGRGPDPQTGPRALVSVRVRGGWGSRTPGFDKPFPVMAGFEPATPRLTVECSTRMSYISDIGRTRTFADRPKICCLTTWLQRHPTALIRPWHTRSGRAVRTGGVAISTR